MDEILNFSEPHFLNLENRDINILLTSQGWKIIELIDVQALSIKTIATIIIAVTIY